MKVVLITSCAVALIGIVSVAFFLDRGALSLEQRANFESPYSTGRGPEDVAVIEQRLSGSGLHPTGLLSDLGVDDHLVRLAAGEVDGATLFSYADAIEALTARSEARGQRLPPPLWDVSTPALLDAGWTVYSLTEALASDEGAIHVNLLSDAYGAFLSTRPDALEGALALLPLARTYVVSLPPEARAERIDHATTDGEATLLIWQALLSGTSRRNPITHRPLWSHGFVGHFSVPHIHQYATGEGLTPSQVWGVGGFDPNFVGAPSNTNQVEHMGISSLLQGVVHVPGAVLSAAEAFEVFVDGEDPDAAAADRALNRAIREVLLLGVEDDPQNIVSALRNVLR
ncbi:hypothetical protein [Rhodophyticola porphyridii]|uniref:hypothetical protein n=1 Tax=Rhodophyticola porphyridii TaxID=1852017 RepID=UPI0035D10E01